MRRRTFTNEDQINFSKFSGDYNPIHLDSVAARRLMGGVSVAHGVHAVFWALDCLAEKQKKQLGFQSLSVQFLKPIVVGEEVECRLIQCATEKTVLSLWTLGEEAVHVELSLDLNCTDNVNNIYDSCPAKTEVEIVDKKDIEGISGKLDLHMTSEDLCAWFPALAKTFCWQQLASILATSRLVGMKCPGMYSRYSSMRLCFNNPESGSSAMSYSVKFFDERFSLLSIEIHSPILKGNIEAFLVSPPQSQPAGAAITKAVEKEEFKGQRAVVIGGSRGLGELTAKLLSAGGAEVVITYNRGEDDARRVVSEMDSSAWQPRCLQYDVITCRKGIAGEFSQEWLPTHIYYFPTPVIFSGVKNKFYNDRFIIFCDYYVGAFLKVFEPFYERGTRCFFFPSSIAIEEQPADMGEYVAAKTAGESLCGFLEKYYKNSVIYRPRLPRLPTDQTASLIPVKTHNSIPVMLDHLRTFQKKCLTKEQQI